MRLRRLFLLICGCLLLTGCPCSSLYPLYTDQDAVAEPRLEGSWGGSDPGDREAIVFEKSGAHEYSMKVFHPDTKVRDIYKVHLVQIDGQLFMDLIADEQTVDGVKLDDQIGVIPTHMIMKVKISEDDLASAILEDDAIKKQTTSKSPRIDYQITDGGSTLLTTPTDSLRRYVAAHADDAFTDLDHLRRTARPTLQK